MKLNIFRVEDIARVRGLLQWVLKTLRVTRDLEEQRTEIEKNDEVDYLQKNSESLRKVVSFPSRLGRGEEGKRGLFSRSRNNDSACFAVVGEANGSVNAK